MKLIRANQKQFTFRISKREKQLLLQILQMYPLVPSSHHQLSKGNPHSSQHEDQLLLEEAMAEQRRENQKQVRAILDDPTRFRETTKTIQFSLAPAEIELLLQALNDVRIGSWLALGQPEELDRPEINPDNMRYFVAMEVAGYFQSAFLAALGLSEALEPEEADN